MPRPEVQVELGVPHHSAGVSFVWQVDGHEGVWSQDFIDPLVELRLVGGSTQRSVNLWSLLRQEGKQSSVPYFVRVQLGYPLCPLSVLFSVTSSTHLVLLSSPSDTSILSVVLSTWQSAWTLCSRHAALGTALYGI